MSSEMEKVYLVPTYDLSDTDPVTGPPLGVHSRRKIEVGYRVATALELGPGLRRWLLPSSLSSTGESYGYSVHITFPSNVTVTPSTGCTLCCAQDTPFEVTGTGHQWTLVHAAYISGRSVELEPVQFAVTDVRDAHQSFVQCFLVVERLDFPVLPFTASVSSLAADEL